MSTQEHVLRAAAAGPCPVPLLLPSALAFAASALLRLLLRYKLHSHNALLRQGPASQALEHGVQYKWLGAYSCSHRAF